MDLEFCRRRIDELDIKLLELLNARAEISLQIGAIKAQAGKAIHDPVRENQVRANVAAANRGPLGGAALRAIFREIMSAMSDLQRPRRIAYLGPVATFTHQAAHSRFGGGGEFIPARTIADVFSLAEKGEADYGVVPIENSTEGVVNSTLDMFVDSDLKIVSQIILPIQHCLVGLGSRNAIKKLYSHPQALAQCRGWVQNHLPHAEVIESSSTTRAAEMAVNDKAAAAIASSLAAERYHLRILQPDIQDNSENATRFLVLGRQSPPATGHDRTSLMLSIADNVGALHRSLAPFRRYRINLTKIESRPSKRIAWKYFFFIDLDGHIPDRRIATAIEHVQQHCNLVKVLVSYPNTE